MSPKRSKLKTEAKRHSFSIHPLRIFVFLIIGGISTLFVSLTLAYAYARIENGIEPVEVPWIFYANSANLLLASLTIFLARKAFSNDRFSHFRKLLFATIIFSFIFLLIQVLGWEQLLSLNKDVASNARSYLYLISGLHFLHLIVGLPFLLRFYWKSGQDTSDQIARLLYLSDERNASTLGVIIVYWHFLDALWLYLCFLVLIPFTELMCQM